MRAKTPATLSAVFFRKLIFSKKFARPCPPPPGPPPLDPPPWTPPMDPPHGPPIFFKKNFQFWTTGAPFYIFFFYYITVFLFIFSLFLFTFLSIIECRAVVLQPPQPSLVIFGKKKKLLCVRENIVTCVWAGSRRVWRVQPANIVIYYKFILFVLKGLFCQDDVEATYVSICFSCI